MNRSGKQILRAFGAQEDTLGRFVRGEKGETMCPPSSFKRGRSLERGRRTHRFSFLSSHEATERVFLSAEGAKDLLVGSIHRSRKTASVSINRSAKLAEPPRAARG